MSKPRRFGAIERTCAMLDLVRQCYPSEGVSLSHVVMEEVAPGTGWSAAQRWADVLALGVWPSKGLGLDGYEIKASKADVKKELSDPDKHRALSRYCNHWWLVAWDESVLVNGLPDSWGVMVTTPTDGGEDERELKVLKNAPVLTPEPWPLTFICSLVRNAYQQSPGAAYVARASAAAFQRGLHDGEEQSLEPLKRYLYGDRRWEWPQEAHDSAAVVAAVLAKLNQGVLPLETPNVP